MRSLLIVVSFVFASSAFSQAVHNTVPFSTCKFSKNRCKGDPEGCSICVACAQDDLKEKKAKEAETERRYKEEAKKADAKNKAAQAKMQKEIDESLRNNKSRELLVSNAPSTSTPVKAIAKPAAASPSTAKPQPGKLNYSFSDIKMVKASQDRSGKTMADWVGEFYDERGQLIVRDKKWYSAMTIAESSFTVGNAPNNFGKVLLQGPEPFPEARCDRFGNYYGAWDLVTPTGQSIFNNKYIYEIRHVKNGWFMLTVDSSDQAHYTKWSDQLYNIYTGQYVPLKRKFTWGRGSAFRCDGVYDLDSHEPLEHFIPLFNAKDSVRNWPYANYSRIKKKAMDFFGSAITESMLEKYALVLLCQEAVYSDLTGDLSALYAKRPYHELLLISNDGTVEWRRLEQEVGKN